MHGMHKQWPDKLMLLSSPNARYLCALIFLGNVLYALFSPRMSTCMSRHAARAAKPVVATDSCRLVVSQEVRDCELRKSAATAPRRLRCSCGLYCNNLLSLDCQRHARSANAYCVKKTSSVHDRYTLQHRCLLFSRTCGH